MNWKSILYKGLPVLIIAIAIVVVAILLSRPEPLPQVTDEDKTIIEFKDYKVTKGQLYDLLKISTDVDSMTNTGLATLINKINQELLDKALENYEVDQDKLDEKIAAEIDKLDEDTYYEKLILLGIIDSKNDPDLNDKLANYYKLDFLKEAYAYEQAEKEVDEDEEALNEAIDDYKDMACGIILKYNTKSQADSIERQLETEEEVKLFFIDKWKNLQKEKDEDDDDLGLEDIFKSGINEFELVKELTDFLAGTSSSYIVMSFPEKGVSWQAGFRDIIKEPEFLEKDFILNFLSFLEEFSKEPEKLDLESNIKVFIGEENPFEKGHDFSLICSENLLNNKEKLRLSLIGPKRMDYYKNIKLINSLVRMIDEKI